MVQVPFKIWVSVTFLFPISHFPSVIVYSFLPFPLQN
jgi:hypothetical protein